MTDPLESGGDRRSVARATPPAHHRRTHDTIELSGMAAALAAIRTLHRRHLTLPPVLDIRQVRQGVGAINRAPAPRPCQSWRRQPIGRVRLSLSS